MEEYLFYYTYLLQLHPENHLPLLSCVQNEFLQNVQQIIEDSLDKPVLSVGYLAKRLAVSKSTLNRKLFTLTGLTANEFIRQQRLKKAASFLLQGKNVSEAAYSTGFETPSYFTQCFKAFYKITPKEYSRNHFIKKGDFSLMKIA